MNAPSAPARPPTICLAVHQGFAVRYMLQTDILPRLLAEAGRIVVVAPRSEAAGITRLVPPGVAVEATPESPAAGRLGRYLYLLRTALHAGFVATAAEVRTRNFEDTSTLLGRWTVRALHALGRTLAQSRATRRLVPVLEGWLFPGRHFDDLVRRYAPDLVVVTSTGYFGFDAEIARAARRHGARVVVVALSWDNITSKPYPSFLADYAVAWTEQMKRQLVAHVDFRSTQVVVGGVAHFDIYRRSDSGFDRDAVVRELGLDPAQPVVAVATKSPNTYLWNPDVVEVLARAVEDRKMPPCQIVVRVHPIHYRRDALGNLTYGKLLALYREQARRYPFVGLSEPGVLDGSGLFVMDAEESQRTARLLRASDVVVNFFSTITIEAALLDKPVVNVCFEGGKPMYPTKRTARNDIRSDAIEDHNQRIVDSGGTAIAYTPGQLVEHVARYLQDPRQDGAARALIASREAGPNGGRAGRFIADHLVWLARAPGASVVAIAATGTAQPPEQPLRSGCAAEARCGDAAARRSSTG